MKLLIQVPQALIHLLLTIQDNFTSTSVVMLTGGVRLTTSLALEVLLNLSEVDVISLQQDLNVATAENTTWLLYTSQLITDAYGNPIQPTFDGINATMAESFTPDFIRPTVIQFAQLSLQENIFTVIFSEPILPNSYIPSGLSFALNHREGLNSG